ncbi:MAG: DUF2442 domain-containing protein, partial [Alphaproteobacteria bacterium]
QEKYPYPTSRIGNFARGSIASPTITHVDCNQNHLIVTLSGGQEIRTPLWHYPRLLNATPEQR